jgi:hypothetical protein
MARLLLCSGKKFLSPLGYDLLIDYYETAGSSLASWIKQHYHVAVVKEQPIPDTDIILVTVIDKQNDFTGTSISFTRMSNILKDIPGVVNYLKKLQPTMEVQLHYGILQGRLISIEEVPIENKGLRCGCVCPGCGGMLIANLKDDKRRKHFSHYKAECNITYAQQTALHMIAKDILAQEKVFMFPGYSITLDDFPKYKAPWRRLGLPLSMEYRKPYRAECLEVTLEKRVSNFVPDIVVNIQGRRCLIEIAVTHFVDEEKQKKIGETRLPVVEVDLSAFLGQQITREIIRDALVVQVDNKRWLYNPKREEALAWGQIEYQKLYQMALEREEEEHKEQLRKEQEYAKKRERQERKREETAFLLEDLFEPENYKYELKQLRSDEQFQLVLNKLHLRKVMGPDVPFYLDIPITGEMVFACDRRIWQATLFDKFIYYRKDSEHENVKVGIYKIQECFKKYVDYIPIEWKLTRSVTIQFGRSDKKFSLFYDVIKQYLEYLHYIGFISKLYYGEGYVEQTKTIIPPKAECATLLQSAIERVDTFAPNVDEQIDKILHPPYIPRYHRIYAPAPRIEIDSQEQESTQNDALEDYRISRMQVWDYDFDSDEPIYDSNNRRWVKCKNCGAIKRDDEMVEYGGKLSVNKGTCRSCKRQIIP